MIKKILGTLLASFSEKKIGTLLAYNIDWFTESTWIQRLERNGQLYKYYPKK